jgi:hypothetical protein
MRMTPTMNNFQLNKIIITRLPAMKRILVTVVRKKSPEMRCTSATSPLSRDTRSPSRDLA